MPANVARVVAAMANSWALLRRFRQSFFSSQMARAKTASQGITAK
jgi:hypothetical protein